MNILKTLAIFALATGISFGYDKEIQRTISDVTFTDTTIDASDATHSGTDFNLRAGKLGNSVQWSVASDQTVNIRLELLYAVDDDDTAVSPAADLNSATQTISLTSSTGYASFVAPKGFSKMGVNMNNAYGTGAVTITKVTFGSF